ncbi:hypothetical protein AcV5_002487 [Taiwanofungus camphoratus]|nr:hypothetical protein AcV5_002487 [Antrodia cinnamomea]KAI0942064.1 hypothetical protein AcV7_002597 [Antrodia cinnamomea]
MAYREAHPERTKQDLEVQYKNLKKSLEEHYLSYRKEPYATHSQRHHIPAVPDLRFEQSYLRSIAPYVRIERLKVEGNDEKGKRKAVEANGEREGDGSVVVPVASVPRETIQIQWGQMLWITTRDQVVSPLLQGALWGVAREFLHPMMSILRAQIQSWWDRGATRANGPHTEGHGVGWLRNWIASLTAGSTSVTHNISFSK